MVGRYPLLCGYICLLTPVYAKIDKPTLTILFSGGNGIFKISMNPAGVSVHVLKGTVPVSIDYDPIEQKLYWTNAAPEKIKAKDMKEDTEELIMSFNASADLYGIAVDSIARKIFYTDRGNKVIAALNINETNCVNVINNGLDQPRAIVLHKENRKMYWTDRGATPYIASADYDGANIRKIVTTGLGWPDGLTIDKKKGILFWCDAKTYRVESVSVDGSQRKRLLYQPGYQYLSIFYHEGVLYFTARNRSGIIFMPSTGGNRGEFGTGIITNVIDVRVFSNRNYFACPVGRYGEDCRPCGNCKGGSVCEKTTGLCMATCSHGYHGGYCREACTSGTHGENCESECGNCAGVACDPISGSCPQGCEGGWHGIDCKTGCPANKYGTGCTACGLCAGDEDCDKTSGACPAGCRAGWTGNKCDRPCLPNTYGASCEPCGQCAGGVPCDKISGLCSAGCQEGWSGSLCKTPCIPGTHGAGCLSLCSHCKTGSVCHQVTGQCPEGCQQGWRGAKCDESVGETGAETNNTSLLIGVNGASAGGVVLIVIIAIIVAVAVLARRKQRSRPNVFRAATDQCPAYLSTIEQAPAPKFDAYPAPTFERIPMQHMSNITPQSTEEYDDHLYESPVF
ncbi:pro-epidermal growth factor-like [Haliotis cracherodii]|uniref:pro-epidermal growth factor-like n=1 Tax=Haliotis cracherodii TaxID=6455 RepID=UPI0039E9AE4C